MTIFYLVEHLGLEDYEPIYRAESCEQALEFIKKHAPENVQKEHSLNEEDVKLTKVYPTDNNGSCKNLQNLLVITTVEWFDYRQLRLTPWVTRDVYRIREFKDYN